VEAGSLVDKVTDIETAITAGTVETGTAGTASTDVVTVQGIASMTPIAVSGTFWQATQPVSGTVAGAGGATAANQSTANTSLSSIDGKLPTLVSSRVPVVVGAALPAGTNNIGDVDVLSLVPGTGATNLGKAEDVAHSSGDTGVMALAVRRDTL